ncbi:MAG: carbon monoxide dehydrogenase [Streptosporangiales bacterium]|nr:carbon monoxide dehydrogenase [Streptosporangiales bacterium]
MELEHEFTVPVGVKEAWDVLLDVERIAPCMPGATVLDVRGDEFAGTVRVKVGPIAMTYAGDARFAEKDEAAHRVVMEAAGKESRGSGTAKATVTATLAEAPDGGTAVRVVTDLTVTGRPAQFGRGMLQDVGGRLIGQFADNLAQTLQEDRSAASATNGGGSASSTATPSPSPGVEASVPPRSQPAEALDLLQLTGVSGFVAKYKVPIVGAVAGGLLLWFVLRKRRRS